MIVRFAIYVIVLGLLTVWGSPIHALPKAGSQVSTRMPVYRLAQTQPVQPQPRVKEFSPLRRFHVAPAAAGDGTLSNPMGIDAALANAQPGDLYWLRRGTYRGGFLLSRSGTQTNPIVFRAYPGERATIEGGFQIEAAHTWIWNLEFTNPNPTAKNPVALNVHAPGVHVINNVIHDLKGGIAIGAWNLGPGQVLYGNVVYNMGLGDDAYNVYGQNDFARFGYKYLVNNILLDTPSFNLHLYTEKGAISGFYLFRNILRGGRVLIGGAVQADNEVIAENFFYQTTPQFGYSKPAQVEFKDNYVVASTIYAERYWGIGGDPTPKPTRPNVFTGNTILSPPGPHIVFRTAVFLNGQGAEGGARIPSADVFNHNIYSAPFQGLISCG